MIRNTKALGLAFVVAATAFSMMAAAAQATQLHVNTPQKAVLTGEQIAKAPHALKHKFQITTTNAGPNVQCNQSQFEGTVQGGEPQITVQEVTVTGTYTGCTFLGLAATITMNGCKFIFTNAVPTVTNTANVDITGCTAAAPRIEVHVPGCTLTVKEQHNKPHVTFTQVGTHVDVTANVQKITYETHGAACVHPETTVREDATYQGVVTLKAHKDVEPAVQATTHNGHQYFKNIIGQQVSLTAT